jgi:hypothetical protein
MLIDKVLIRKPATKKTTGPRAKQTKKDKDRSKKEDEYEIHKKNKKQ